MKNLKHIMLLFLSFVVLASCGSSKPSTIENKTTTITLKETVHDTVFKIEKDSSSYQALLECQNGKVVIKDVTHTEPGRKLKSPKVRVADNLLNVDCETQAQDLFASWKSKYIKEYKQEIKVVPKITNILTWWQETQIKGFWLVAFIMILKIILRIIKNKLKTPL